jgi:hypothetical protein
MKQSIKLFVVAAFVLLSVESQATSWRVCSKPEARANFTSVREAVTSLDVFAGDTLYLEPGHVELGNTLTINKQLTIIGPGYRMNDNNINVMDANEAIFNTSSIQLTAAGTDIYGCVFLNTLELHSDNHTIEHCYFQKDGYCLYMDGIRNDLLIRGNFFNNTDIHHYGSGSVWSSTFENNIIKGRIYIGGYSSGYHSCIFRNNTIIWQANDVNTTIQPCTGCEIYNNVLIHYSSGYSTTTNTTTQTVDTTWYRNYVLSAPASQGNDVHHNIMSCSPNSEYRNCVFNISNPEMALIWDNATSLEEKYKHIANGIAVGAGSNGTTIGAYGAVNGSTPYRPAGIPKYRPYIYDANIDQTPSSNNTINASFKIKVQND